MPVGDLLLLYNNAIATTYLVAAKELQILLSFAALTENLSRRGVECSVEWRASVIPKRTPLFGGFWERLVGLTKSSFEEGVRPYPCHFGEPPDNNNGSM